MCDDLAGRHLGRRGPTNSPQREQCRSTAHGAAHWARGAKTRSPYDQSEGALLLWVLCHRAREQTEQLLWLLCRQAREQTEQGTKYLLVS